MNVHRGHRENPIEVLSPGDVDLAVTRVWDPTSGQARAGNYKMAHANVHGLDITIETPKHRQRKGVGPDGTPWSVTMPAHYGYVKRTLGSDGDHVDVYLGEHAHIAHVLPVWIVDQCDAENGAFDEHKCMIGFTDSNIAKETFFAAFSDGKGPLRVGSVAQMNFETFKRWLNSENTKNPVSMKSASEKTESTQYAATTCSHIGPCTCEKSTGDNSMPPEATHTDPTPSGIGKIMSILHKGLSGLKPSEQQDLLAEAASLTKGEIGKASEFLAVDETVQRLGYVPDQWSGPPDGRLSVTRAHGPGSQARSGNVNTGPAQSASGDGAEKMEREYSQFATQYGVQVATEALGREIAGMRGAMKSFVSALEGQGLQIELLSKAQPQPGPTAADIEAMITKAVTSAVSAVKVPAAGDISDMVAKAVKKAIAKAEEDKEDKDEKADSLKIAAKERPDDEADDDESAKAAAKPDDEHKDEDDDKDETGKAITAGVLRTKAANRVKWAVRRLSKAEDLLDEKKLNGAARNYGMALYNLGKAVTYAEAAKAVFTSDGEGTQQVAKAIAKAKKGIGDFGVEMQTKWPASDDKMIGKGGEAVIDPGTQNPAVMTPEAMKSVLENINKAVNGMAVLTTDMGGIVRMMFGQSRSVAPGGERLPPVFDLAKANVDEMTVKEREIVDMGNSRIISMDELERAREFFNLAKQKNVPPEFVQSKLERLSPMVKSVITRNAA